MSVQNPGVSLKPIVEAISAGESEIRNLLPDHPDTSRVLQTLEGVRAIVKALCLNADPEMDYIFGPPEEEERN